MTNDIVERREHKRLQLKGDGVALLRTSSPNCTIVVEIIDISAGSVAFRCIAGEEQSNGSAELSLVSANQDLELLIKSL